MKTVTMKWAYDNRANINIIDVRTPAEYQVRGFAEAKNIPLAGLVSNHEFFLDKSKTYYIMCASGGRSWNAVANLEKFGYDVIQCEGGIGAIRMDGE